MPRISNFPISRGWDLRIILDFLEAKGVPWHPLARKAGLPQRLPDAESFLPTRSISQLLSDLSLDQQFPEMTLAAHLNEGGRLAISKPIPRILRSFLAAPTLYAALCRLERDSATHWSNLRFWVEECNEAILWCSRSTTDLDAIGHRLLVQSRVAQMLATLHHFLGFDWRPDTLYLECDQVPSALLESLLDGPRVIVHAPFTGFSIARSLLTHAGPWSGDACLIKGVDEPEIATPVWGWRHRLQAVMQVYAQDGHLTLDIMAEALRVHPRTLQRALRDEGCSFRELAEHTRMEVARGHLCQQTLSISEIAEMLGYAEPTNFARAFRRYSGQSPAAFRRHKAWR